MPVLSAPQVVTRGIAVSICSSGRACPVEWALALANQSYPPNTNLAWIHVVGESVAEARNRCVEEARKYKCKYLWFLDDDTVPPFDAARQLMYVLDQAEVSREPVVACGGVYCIKQDPPAPLVFAGPGQGPFWNWKLGEVFPVWGIGTGCLMIRMDAFDRLEPPYFKTSSEVGLAETDDLYFCAKLAQAGLQVRAHGGVQCRHWDITRGLIYTLPQNSFPCQPKATNGP